MQEWAGFLSWLKGRNLAPCSDVAAVLSLKKPPLEEDRQTKGWVDVLSTEIWMVHSVMEDVIFLSCVSFTAIISCEVETKK